MQNQDLRVSATTTIQMDHNAVVLFTIDRLACSPLIIWTLTEHRKGPRPVSCKVNLRFRRFGYGTGQVTGLTCYYIGLPRFPFARYLLAPVATIWPKRASDLEPATISACTITMDHDAIICSIIDRLARGPDKDVHAPKVGSQKYPSRGVDVIYS